jgi:copper transport protein
MRKVRTPAVLLVLITLAWAGATAVQAHAVLLRSIPQANAVLTASPDHVELYFSEAVTARFSRVSVMDSQGQRVNSGEAQPDPADAAHLLAPLPLLGTGVYTVVWSAISAVDGHETYGAFPFAVGQANAAALAQARDRAARSQLPAPVGGPAGAMILKGLLYLAAAALTGGILFTSLVWLPTCRQAAVPPEAVSGYARKSHALMLAALVVLAAADILSLMLLTGQSQAAAIGWPWQPAFFDLLGTRIGILGILRLGLVVLLAALILPRQAASNRWAALGLCLALLLTFSLTSHAAAEPRPLLPILADWLHMTAVSVWVGGLFFFLGAMGVVRRLAPEPQTRLASLLIPPFTVVAMTCVGVLTLTGVYSALLHVGGPNALVGTTYGRALVVKLLIAAPMLALGAFHFLVTTPGMRRAAARPGGSPKWVRSFSTLLTIEAGLGAVLLLWVGVFTTLPPAATPLAPGEFRKTARADDLSVTLDIVPARPGLNAFTATISSGGHPVTDARDVSLEFTSVSGVMPLTKAAMTGQGNGQYLLQAGNLMMADNWDIKVVVIRPGKFDAYADFKIDMSGSAGMTMP